VNGVKNSMTELNSFLHENGVKTACLQETRLSAKAKKQSFLNYSVLRKDRPVGNDGGIAILVHHSISCIPIDLSDVCRGDDVIELQGIMVTVNGSPINIFNLYIPPSSSCPPAYKPSLITLFDFSDSDTIVMGDFNAHHEAWFASSICSRGDAFIEEIENSNFCVLNSDTPTRLPSQ
jgi:exonuclease III